MSIVFGLAMSPEALKDSQGTTRDCTSGPIEMTATASPTARLVLEGTRGLPFKPRARELIQVVSLSAEETKGVE